MTRRGNFAQIDVARALRGAKAAGVPIDQMEIEIVRSTGNIVLRPAIGGISRDAGGANEWDAVLPRDTK